MSASTDNKANLPRTTPSEVDSQVRFALGAGDAGSAQAIRNLTLIHHARVSQLKRTAATLKKQNGTGDPETKAAEAAVKTGSARAASLAVIHLQAATASPQVAAHGWALHGRVLKPKSASASDPQWGPASDLTVFLADDRQQFQAQYGYSYTDSTGYFLLNFSGKKDHAETSGPLFLQVWNKKKQPVYVSKTAFAPVTGTATYQNIFLPAGEKPLGDPPDEVRSGPTTRKAAPKNEGKAD